MSSHLHTREYATGRPATVGFNGMVTSPHSLASAAGVDILRAGGTAVDAAIATGAVLSVAYPHMTGLGGDAFWLIHDGTTGSVKYLNGGGRAAASAETGWFKKRSFEEIPLRGIIPATLTVPGAVASWTEAHAAYGRLPLGRVLESAICYARDGVPVTSRLAKFVDLVREELTKYPETAAIFVGAGEAARVGAKIVNPDLAGTLESVARDGWSGFYEGKVAEEMVRWSIASGGFFSLADFGAQKAEWGNPVQGQYRDVTIFNTPPPTQGFTVIEMMNLLEPLELQHMPFLGLDHIHFLVQAKQIAFNDRDRLLGDPRFVDVPVEKLLSKSYARNRSYLMAPNSAIPWNKVPTGGSLEGDTVYVAAVDRWGNAVSLIQSLYSVFGSMMVAGKTGVVLQNRSSYFTLDTQHPNRLEPGKIPMHTLIASIGKRNGKLWSVLGCMGADGQPQIQLQAYVAMIDFGLDVQMAVEVPRFLSGRFGLGESRDTLNVEGRFPQATLTGLAQKGHLLNRWGEWSDMAGHAHGITIDQDTGALWGGSDPRSDGAAIGY